MQDDTTPNLRYRKNRNLSEELIALGNNSSAQPESSPSAAFSTRESDALPGSAAPESKSERHTVAATGNQNRTSVFNGIAILALALAITCLAFLTHLALQVEDLLASSSATVDQNPDIEALANRLTALIENSTHENNKRMEQLENQLKRMMETLNQEYENRKNSISAVHASNSLDKGVVNSTVKRPEQQPTTRASSSDAADVSTEKTNTLNTSPALWFVNLGTFSSEVDAGNFQKSALAAHPGLEIVPVTLDETTMFRVRTEGLESKQKAETIAQQLQIALQLSGVWVAQARQ
ncbi:MAG TPA: hypothetical protein DCF62_09545 [Porticoccaceae bacterium]|nr:hypothetical protein [Porticoccaceae bacterium]